LVNSETWKVVLSAAAACAVSVARTPVTTSRPFEDEIFALDVSRASHGAVASAPLVGDHRCRALRNPRAADHAAAVQPTSNDRARDRTGDLRYGSHRWTDRVEGRTDRGAVAGRRPGRARFDTVRRRRAAAVSIGVGLAGSNRSQPARPTSRSDSYSLVRLFSPNRAWKAADQSQSVGR
jgi:hypothetical protein